ncbi:hypothetical protein GCM10020216_076560 [Nonomuraea helvata]
MTVPLRVGGFGRGCEHRGSGRTVDEAVQGDQPIGEAKKQTASLVHARYLHQNRSYDGWQR